MERLVEATRRRVMALLERHGRDTMSFLTLESRFRYWFHGPDACVAYVDTGGAWVAAGGPIAAVEREAEVMGAFAAAARTAGRRVRFFGVEHELAADVRFDVLHLGEQPVWDPAEWNATLRQKRSLREQLRRARAKGVTIRRVHAAEIGDREGATRRAVDALVERWLGARSMAPMGFVVHVAPFELPEERRFLAAECDGRLVGFLVAAPIYARDGWLIQHVLRDPSAPNGTVELLFDAALRLVAAQRARMVTFGLAPLAGTPSRVLRFVRAVSRPLYDFEGLARFKRKLLPASWHPVYLAFPRGDHAWLAVFDSLAAFAHGSFLRFGWQTLRHRARLVVAILAWLLVPWTLLLSAANAERWFPDRWVQAGWVAWDIVLFAGLLTLARLWRTGLATLLAWVAATDFTLGIVQLVAWNAAHIRTVSDVVIASLALCAPAFAAWFLWVCRSGRGVRS